MKTIWALAAALLMAGASSSEETGGAPARGLVMSGFVDASYFGNIDIGGDGFRLDQVELDLVHELPEGVVLRADLETSGDGALGVEQGWLRLPLPLIKTWSLTFGKFNAPLGVELLDAPDMQQYSHSLLFDDGLPVNLTGALAEGPVAGPASLKLFVVNGWDINDEDNPSRSLGARLGLDLGPAGGLGLSLLTGRENGVKTPGPEDLQVVDLDYLVRPRQGLQLCAELNLGTVQPLGGSSMTWSGWMLAGHQELGPVWGLTARYDSMSDKDGVLYGRPGGETRSSLTAAITAAAGAGRTVLLEARMDSSSEKVFPDGEGGLAASTITLALEFAQTF